MTKKSTFRIQKIKRSTKKMRYLMAMIVVVLLVCLFFCSLANISEHGFLALLFAALSGYALYKIFKPRPKSSASRKSRDNN